MQCLCGRRLMGGRKGWSSIEVPGGWLQVIRGPRPPASKWPLVQRKPSAAVQKALLTDRQGGRWRNRGVDPDTKMAEAHAKVERLHAEGPQCVGKSRRPEVDAIKRSLKKAQEAARERPISEFGEGVQGVHRSVHEANHKIASGVGCGDRIAPGEPCTFVEVGGAGGSNPSHTRRHGTRCEEWRASCTTCHGTRSLHPRRRGRLL